MNNNEKGMDFGKPKLTRQDVMRILRISATTLWRWERDKKIIPQFTLGRQAATLNLQKSIKQTFN